MTVKRDAALRVALVLVGAICLALGPLMLVWPSGWRWSPHQAHYEQMLVGLYFTLGTFLIRAAKEPMRHLGIIWFAVWSSIVHASIMTIQAVTDSEHRGHLLGDVRGVFLGAAVISVLVLRRQRSIPSVPVPE